MKDKAKIIIGPVSVLSVVGKIYEKAMYKHLCGYLECHNILYSLQFGFRQKCSTNHALISITESIHYLNLSGINTLSKTVV